MKLLKEHKHIIWDYNGTLLDDIDLCLNVINDMLSKRKIPTISKSEYKELFSFPVRDYYQKIGFDFNLEPFEVVGSEFMNSYNERRNEIKLHSGTIQILNKIKESGIRQYILSARDHKDLTEELDKFKIAGYFSVIRGLDNHYAHGKEQIAAELVQHINFTKEKILMIGDTFHDAQVAESTGINCILISHGHHSDAQLAKSGKNIYKSFEEILNV